MQALFSARGETRIPKLERTLALAFRCWIAHEDRRRQVTRARSQYWPHSAVLPLFLLRTAMEPRFDDGLDTTSSAVSSSSSLRGRRVVVLVVVVDVVVVVVVVVVLLLVVGMVTYTVVASSYSSSGFSVVAFLDFFLDLDAFLGMCKFRGVRGL